ncbi:hypothetical protein GCM10010222_26730 [Streptomyces tanashiensis]|nr:hypothetical protein GCM10010222_26730 [Streptomyces tanashiensis]
MPSGAPAAGSPDGPWTRRWLDSRPHSKSKTYGVSSSMSEASTDGTESNGSGKHRGQASPAEDSTSSPHGRHRREADAHAQ